MTVCAVGNSSLGWKKGGKFQPEESCYAKKSFEDLTKCVKNNQFTLNDTILSVSVHKKGVFKTEYPSWKSSMASTALGVCHTLVYKKLLSTTQYLHIGLKQGSAYEPSSYKIYLHDPTFFLHKSDNYFLPFVFLDKPKGENYKIVTSQNARMNRPGKFSCNQDPSYNFNKCVSNNLATQIGCMFPWAAEHTNKEFQICNTTEKVKTYWEFYNTMYLATQQSLEDLTGCLVPCRYNRYSLVGKPESFELINFTYIALSFASTDLTDIKEVLSSS